MSREPKTCPHCGRILKPRRVTIKVKPGEPCPVWQSRVLYQGKSWEVVQTNHAGPGGSPSAYTLEERP